jgi:hypothetical protein
LDFPVEAMEGKFSELIGSRHFCPWIYREYYSNLFLLFLSFMKRSTVLRLVRSEFIFNSAIHKMNA